MAKQQSNNRRQQNNQNRSQRSRQQQSGQRQRRDTRQQSNADKRRQADSQRKSGGRKNDFRKRKNTFGNVLMIVQAIVSLAFLGVLVMLDMLPVRYLSMIGMILLCLWLTYILSQLKRRKGGWIGKVYGILVIALLMVGTFYIARTNNMIAQITGNGSRTNTTVVAVLESDPAQSIQDAVDYNFGVQFSKDGDSMQAALNDICEEVGQNIETTQYDDISSQAEALRDGEVEAIIYNKAYSAQVEEVFSGYEESVRIIYTHKTVVSLNLGGGEDDSLTTKPFTLYISGIDMYDDDGGEAGGGRSDVNIIAVVNPTTHQILLVTTPRDYYVVIPGISEGNYDKLTHAGTYGIDASMNTLSELYETEINYYARLNFPAMIEIVDVLGGIDVDSEYAFTTSEDSGLVMDVQQGMNHFNGEQALAFSRERQNLDDGDNQRGKNQQAVITAMIKKMLSPTMLLKANGILNSVGENVEMNVSQEQINSLIKYQLRENPTWYISSVAAEGYPSKEYCYSMGDTLLYVTLQDEESVEYIIELANVVEEGGTLEGAQQLN